MPTTKRLRIAVLGDGGWGTTLALLLHRRGHDVRWWGAFPEHLIHIARRGENTTHLPGIRIPRELTITPNLSEATEHAHLIVMAVPSQYARATARRLAGEWDAPAPVLSVAKGIEHGSLKRMSQVLREELGRVPLAALSGPNIAAEIAQGHPASSVVASADARLAAIVQRAFSDERFRVYTSPDIIGVELGGALKNPVAIAAGISDGLGLGANAKAALITRGVVEMARLGVALGARERTLWGLSGLGDLVTTCLGGRNRWLGEQLGRGRSLHHALHGTDMVIEGVETTRAAVGLGRREHIELPIIEQVDAVLFHHRPPRQALLALMRRSHKAESSRRSG